MRVFIPDRKRRTLRSAYANFCRALKFARLPIPPYACFCCKCLTYAHPLRPFFYSRRFPCPLQLPRPARMARSRQCPVAETFYIFGLDFLRKACRTMRNHRVCVAPTPAGPLPEAAPPQVHPTPTPANRS